MRLMKTVVQRKASLVPSFASKQTGHALSQDEKHSSVLSANSDFLNGNDN
jgi:hypothetical protein